MEVDNNKIRENNFNRFLENIAKKKFILDSGPIQVVIGLTNVCNLHCAFCSYCGFCMKKIEKGEMLPFEVVDKLRSFLKAAKIVIPSGRGEPLAYDKFAEFMAICKETGAVEKIQLINNGTLIDRYEANLFEGINIFSISFDSINKDVFELLRYGSNYEKILKNIKSLRQQLPNLIMQFNVTVNRLNMDEMMGIYNLAREIGINYISYNSIYGSEEDKVIQLLRLRDSDREFIREQIEHIQQLNSDNALSVIDEVTWTQYEDGVVYNKKEIFNKLLELKNIVPYMDYDEIDDYEKESRRVHIENRKNQMDVIALPYCTSPFCVMQIQPNQDIYPCCALFGPIDSLVEKNVWDAWNCEEFQLLREAMFDYDMLPEYCKQCRAFTRYDYINEYIEKIKEQGSLNYNKLVIPPNYFPPTGLIHDEKVAKKIFEQNIKELYKKDFLDSNEVSGLVDAFYEEIGSRYKEKLKVKENELIKTKEELLQEINEREIRILNARDACNKVNSSITYKIICIMVRFANQFLKGNRIEKKKFLNICKNSIIGRESEFTRNDGYNMILNVRNAVDGYVPIDVEVEKKMGGKMGEI